ncbi:MAG: CAP domain-containing protein [Propionibacteriaceae bacterium]|nr:CAP domain-containing protein [Propionibacteriaceae bacterium]
MRFRSFTLSVAISMVGIGLTAPVSANAGVAVNIDNSSIESVRSGYSQWFEPLLDPARSLPQWNGSTDSCDPGSTGQEARERTLSAVNYFREMAGLKSVRLASAGSSMWNQVQQAALIMQANATLTHTPDSSMDCYTSAGKAGAMSNLILYESRPAETVRAFVADNSNIRSGAGHRFYLFRPQVKTIAVGYTGNGSRAAGALKVETGSANYTPVAWPSAGYFPKELGTKVWTYQAGSDGKAAAGATVKVYRNAEATPVVSTKVKDGYWWAMPYPLSDTGAGVDVYHVVISGKNLKASYDVKYFSAATAAVNAHEENVKRADVNQASASGKARVKDTAKITGTLTKAKGGKTKVKIKVKGESRPTGKVTVMAGNKKVGKVTLKKSDKGKKTITAKLGKAKTLKIVYAGDKNLAKTTKTYRLR